jgi:hypothetical protein
MAGALALLVAAPCLSEPSRIIPTLRGTLIYPKREVCLVHPCLLQNESSLVFTPVPLESPKNTSGIGTR